jgi:hypothetical protein
MAIRAPHGEEFQVHRVEYDVAATQRSMQAAGFDEYFYENLSFGLRIGASIPRA